MRLKEAAASLSILGVDRAHIFCLGYGDTINGARARHIFYAEDQPSASPQGSAQTYGAAEFSDFSYLARGEHSPYRKSCYIRDLKELILHVRANIIFATDFDWHSDHRMLSLSFDAAMGEILSRPDNDYHPEVFRGFAYSTAFMAPADFFADYLRATAKPNPCGATQKTAGDGRHYAKNIIDTSYYSWEGRVRIPVPADCRRTLLDGHPVADALKQHVSQCAILRATSIINSDEVFWRRRTDSLAYRAQVVATSGDPSHVHDFRLLNVRDVDSDVPRWEDYLWVPEGDDGERRLTFRWDSGQNISRFCLWGNIDGEPVGRVAIRTDTGYVMEAGPLPERGFPLVIDIPTQEGVRECNIQLLSQGRGRSGLAEVEIFAQASQAPVLRPFIQLTLQDNFLYEYDRKPDELSLPVGCYRYRVDEPVRWEVAGPARLEGNTLIFEPGSSEDVTLRAFVAGSDIFCQAAFHATGWENFDRLHREQLWEQKWLARLGRVNAVRAYARAGLRMLRERGVLFLVRRVAQKFHKGLGGRKG